MLITSYSDPGIIPRKQIFEVLNNGKVPFPF